ncbi:MAG TPA: long-chain fatty acid--CoA ligase [Chloroflexota bacterium]|nr:long-chain fatty acid--CoA ligase [Chloroflexota bacterium]
MTVAERTVSSPWLKSYPPDVPTTIAYPKTSIGRLLDQVARDHPNADAVVFEGEALTWRQIHRLAAQFSVALHNLGTRKGDRVVLLLPNVPHFVIAYYAILKLGAVAVAVNPLFTETEIEAYIRKTDASVVLTLDVLYEKIDASWERSGVKRVIVGNALDLMATRVRFAAGMVGQLERLASLLSRASSDLGGRAAAGMTRLEQLNDNFRRIRAMPKPKEPIPFGRAVVHFRDVLASATASDVNVEVGHEDLAVLLYTTGTTGTPKAAMLTHRNLIANAYQMRFWFPEFEVGKETILAVLPFFHAYGLTLVMNAGLALAARSVLIPRVIMKDILEAVQAFRPTALPGVPALFVSIVNSDRVKNYDLRSIRVCVSGGAPLPVEIAERFHAITGGHLYEGYGLTEASPLTHAQPYDRSAPAGSIGLPVADTEAMLVDETGNQAPTGEPGELLVRGPQVMRGYWKEPEDTRAVLHDGWLATGDVARMDENGFFFIVDRKKELIITGGENIAPREIEEAIYRHPMVSEVAVAGIPHGAGGEAAKAFIVLKPDASITEAEMKRWLGDELAHYKVPRSVEFRTELPKSPMGKILRRVLVEEERVRLAERSARRKRSEG